MTNPQTEERPKRTRRFRKRRFTRLPKPALPVKALWELATEEQRKKAHETCAVILEYWLGKATKAEVAHRLVVPPLRVWQISQQALSGMVAGLLKQPRRRKGAQMPLDPENDPKVLRKQVERLKRELKLATDVIALLREMPAHREAKPPPTSPAKTTTRRKKSAAGKKRRPPRRPDPEAGGSVA
jgi:hypothetical protein